MTPRSRVAIQMPCSGSGHLKYGLQAPFATATYLAATRGPKSLQCYRCCRSRDTPHRSTGTLCGGQHPHSSYGKCGPQASFATATYLATIRGLKLLQHYQCRHSSGMARRSTGTPCSQPFWCSHLLAAFYDAPLNTFAKSGGVVFQSFVRPAQKLGNVLWLPAPWCVQLL